MALREKKVSALQMRKTGATYSQIKQELNVSKSTLSLWLRGMPLSEERMRLVRDMHAGRIERYRETRRRTRETRWEKVYDAAKSQIGSLTEREILIAGLFLYWGEGGKTDWTVTVLSNTDPAMLIFFIQWLLLLGVDREKIRARLHLYIDMDIEKETDFWSKALSLPKNTFRKPHIKNSRREDITYVMKYSHGTCDVIVGNRDIAERVQMSLRYLREFALNGKA